MIDVVLAWLQTWAEVIAGVGSVLLTGALVVLYWKQQELLRTELNRDVRSQHTETLRKRVSAWHGDINSQGISESGDFFTDDTNLPTVHTASVSPAPAIIRVAGEDDFRVVPELIEGDRYLEDLLENHAPELDQFKTRIESQHEQFQQEKEAFGSKFETPSSFDAGCCTVSPTSFFSEWVFEQAVRLRRSGTDVDIEHEREHIRESVTEHASAQPDEPRLLFTADTRGDGRTYTFEAVPESDSLDDVNSLREDIADQLVDVYLDALDTVVNGEYEHADTAAETLEEMDETRERLKGKLVEFHGHPIYEGDCQYLNDTTV